LKQIVGNTIWSGAPSSGLERAAWRVS